MARIVQAILLALGALVLASCALAEDKAPITATA
jgi:hypothetical protein